MQLPEFGVRLRKGHACFNRSTVLGAQKNDAAILVLLRDLVGEQQSLSLVDRDAQQQQRTIRIHIQGVRFFMEGFSPRPVAVHVDGDIERRAAASPPVSNLRRLQFGGFRPHLASANQVGLLQGFKNSAHWFLAASLRLPDPKTEFPENIPAKEANRIPVRMDKDWPTTLRGRRTGCFRLPCLTAFGIVLV